MGTYHVKSKCIGVTRPRLLHCLLSENCVSWDVVAVNTPTVIVTVVVAVVVVAVARTHQQNKPQSQSACVRETMGSQRRTAGASVVKPKNCFWLACETYEQSVQKRSAAKHSQYFLRQRDFLHLQTPVGPALAGVLAALLDDAAVVGKPLPLLKEMGVLMALSLPLLPSDS